MTWVLILVVLIGSYNAGSEEVGHDTHLCYRHMNLVEVGGVDGRCGVWCCMSFSYGFQQVILSHLPSRP